jgi:2-oxoisovalerate dehydrogenase E1 component alpha subunit
MTTIAQFEIPYIQFLNEQGELANSPPALADDKDTLQALYRMMVLTRTFDKKAIALQRTGKMGTYAPISGQEAISTAIGHALNSEDIFVPYYRDYAAQFQRGVKMSEILSFWGGDERGSRYAAQAEDLPICVPIASQCLHAAGIAFTFRYRKQPRVALVSIGEGGSSEGDFYEAMNAAGVWQLPLVFVVNNNQWAISVPRDKQTHAQTIAQKAVAAGFSGIQIDGNDIIAARQCIGEAIDKARRGEGPTLIEALTYRLCDHTTADDATRYQPPPEVEGARKKEPISRLKHYLMARGFWSSAFEEQLVIDCATKVDAAVEEYLNTPPQSIHSIFDYHFAELPNYLIEQRAIAEEETTHA